MIEKTRLFVINKYSSYTGKFGPEMMIALTNRMIEMILKKKPKNVNIGALLMGAYFHDIGRTVSDGNDHAKKGLEIANEFMDDNSFFDKDTRKIVEDCIMNHGSNAVPKTKEGRIIRELDKAALIDRRIMRIYLKQVRRKHPDHKAREMARVKLDEWYAKLGEQKEKYEGEYDLCVGMIKNDKGNE